MASSTLLRSTLALSAVNAGLLGALLYNNNNKLERNHEEAEARMDELEGTLRGHIGLIEDALDRLEGKKPSDKKQQLYESRGNDEKKK